MPLRSSVYPGDKAIFQEGTVTIQIHTLDLTNDASRIVASSIPFLLSDYQRIKLGQWRFNINRTNRRLVRTTLVDECRTPAPVSGLERRWKPRKWRWLLCAYGARLRRSYGCHVGRGRARAADPDRSRRTKAPRIQLSGLTALFGIACTVEIDGHGPQELNISILECTAPAEVRPLFAEIASSFLRLLGERPTMTQTAAAIARFSAIFASLTRPSRQSVTGLIGELMLLAMSSNVSWQSNLAGKPY